MAKPVMSMARQSRLFRPPALTRVRLACVDDAPHIVDLVNESMSCNFRVHGTPAIVYLIENCVLSICQINSNDVICGFLAIRDYPLIPSVHPKAWEEYLWKVYKAVELNSRNTLFIHLVCWDSMYTREVLDSLLKSVFMHDPYIHHIAMVKSVPEHPLLIPGQSRAEASFRRVNTIEKGMTADKLPSLNVADRKEVSPRFRIRRAVEEDNDDIIPILEAHSERLRDLYGDYYISELVARHPESERVLLVCEHNEVAVGVMCLNTIINFEALEESFELSPFAGLRKLDAAPKKDIKENDSIASMTLSSMGDQTSFIEDSLVKGRDAKQCRVTWVFDDDEFKDLQPPVTPSHSSQQHVFHTPTPAQLDILHLLEDEEELEFDIINIDTHLLTVPKLMSNETLKTGPVDSIRRIMHSSGKELTYEDKKKEKPKAGKDGENPPPPEPTRYSGAPNAFLLELFAMRHDYDERYGFDMLEVAFELFPDREYCIICFPSTHASFPLLEHFTLVTPYSSRMRFIHETLYVAHVNSVRGNFRVRQGEAYDLTAIFDICERAPHAQVLIDLFESAINSFTLECYVMLSQNQPVGMVVIGPLQDGTTIRTQFELEPEPRRPGTDGMILTGIVAPSFEPHFRWFMRELLRNSRYSSLFWMSKLFAKGDSSPTKHLTSVAGHMIPVHLRRYVPNISGSKDLDKIHKDISVPFALWILERPLTSLPKVYVNSSIVVVGASRTGLAFLEALLLGPSCQYLTFSNVTLVSEHGLPIVTECLKAADTCVPRDGRYTERYLKSVPFYFYLDVMTSVMVGIDRKKKCIYLKGGGVKFYDELVLTCGQQFQHPDYLHGPLQLVKEVEQGKQCERLLMDNPKYLPDKVPSPLEMPENVILINSLYQANAGLRKLLRFITENRDSPECLSTENQVMVYGDCVEAYSCIAALLELGLMPNKITFVESYPPDDPTKCRVNCFNNETVDERVQASLEELGIHVYRRYYLTSWQLKGSHVESVDLMSQVHYTTVPCFAIFYYGLKAIDVNAFKAINECGLVYDGGLVVDTSFETNDPNVYGAGTSVKYSRKLYASLRAHKHYCSEDIGEALAKLFLKKLDPFVMGDETEPDELMPRYSSTILKWSPVMKFESPIMQSATLPGPIYYMKLRKPGIEIPMEVQKCLPHQGHSLITDRYDNYFDLKLNVLHCVDAVTCLAKKQFSCEILSQLYGKHEAFFNKLLLRFKMGLITDLFDFFIQPWLSAIYQETFQDLLSDINEQDVSKVFSFLQSKYRMHDDKDFKAKENEFKMPSKSGLITSQSGSRLIGRQESFHVGTFRSMIDKFVGRKSFIGVIKDSTIKPTDIPSECGQCVKVREEAAAFWRSIGGERLAAAHLRTHLSKTNVVNAHYALPNIDFI